jgi:NodT family efflux transporter outer membrane factor (OMF) lipoprotein
MVGLQVARAAALPQKGSPLAAAPDLTQGRTMNKLALAAAAAALLLAGCAGLSPPPRAVDTPAPPQWQAPLPHNGSLANLQQWWQQFRDPLLIELIERAQAASPTVASAASRVAQARATRAVAAAALQPALDASASAARGNTQPPAPLATTLQAGLQASWEIDLFGGRASARDAAGLRLEAAQAGWHEARVSVAAETANSYIAWRICTLQLAVAGNDARSRAETARLSDLSAKAGFTAPADAALARASAAEASARTTQQRAACDTEFKALVALAATDEAALRGKLATPWSVPEGAGLLSVAALPAQVLAQRPDLYQAAHEVAAASAEVGSAQADLYPRLGLSGSIAAGVVRTGGNTTDVSTWSIGPLSLTLPLFDGGRRAANVDAAVARYQEAAALYSARARQAVREVEQALVALDSARARNDDARIASEGYRVSFSATQARYRSGLASLVELEDARRTALAAETALIALQRERIAAWIALYRAAGGGWEPPDAATTTARR